MTHTLAEYRGLVQKGAAIEKMNPFRWGATCRAELRSEVYRCYLQARGTFALQYSRRLEVGGCCLIGGEN